MIEQKKVAPEQEETQIPEELQIKKDKGSVLFEPFRQIGLIVNEVGFFTHKNSSDRLITVCVGNAFHLYNLDKLRIIYISPSIDFQIKQLIYNQEHTYTLLSNNTIVKWRKQHVACSIDLKTKVTQFLVFGSVLIAISTNSLIVHDIEQNTQVEVELDFQPTFLMHPMTYLNKVVIGGENRLQLWNIKTSSGSQKLVYEYSNIVPSSTILTIEQSPLPDVVGLGTSEGDIIVANLKSDEIIMRFKQDGPVEVLSFSSDSSMETSYIATTSQRQLIFWDLNEGRVASKIEIAHGGKKINNISFLSNEPVLVTSSGDENSIKMWLFDLEAGKKIAPRLLKERSGHSDTPNKIQFYGDYGHHILSSSDNTYLRFNSIFKEQASKSFSAKNKLDQNQINRDGAQIGKTLDFSFSELRERDWSNITTCHSESKSPFLWSFENKALVRTIKKQPAVHVT